MLRLILCTFTYPYINTQSKPDYSHFTHHPVHQEYMLVGRSNFHRLAPAVPRYCMRTYSTSWWRAMHSYQRS
jgi:hypothetical protein